MTHEQIIKELAKQRKAKNIPYLRLSILADKPEQTVRNIFKTDRSPKLSTLISVCDALSLEVEIKEKPSINQ